MPVLLEVNRLCERAVSCRVPHGKPHPLPSRRVEGHTEFVAAGRRHSLHIDDLAPFPVVSKNSILLKTESSLEYSSSVRATLRAEFRGDVILCYVQLRPTSPNGLFVPQPSLNSSRSSFWTLRGPRHPSPSQPARSPLPHSLPRARSHLRPHYRPHSRPALQTGHCPRLG
jgi:hypothetical protein